MYGDGLTEAYIGAASSFHPGGANFAMADGSVRFIKDTIDSWPMDAQTATPLGVIQDSNGLFQLTGGTRFHVYQALTTRNGGEIISRQLLRSDTEGPFAELGATTIPGVGLPRDSLGRRVVLPSQSLTTPSRPAEYSRRSWGAKRTAETRSPCPSSDSVSCPPVASQTCTTASEPQVAIRRLSGLKLRESTPRGHSTVAEIVPLDASQIRILPPLSVAPPPPARSRPSGLKARLVSWCGWDRGPRRRRPDVADQTRTVRSMPPEARAVPVGS